MATWTISGWITEYETDTIDIPFQLIYSQLTVNNATESQALTVAIRGDATYVADATYSAPGHMIGVLGHVLMDSAGTTANFIYGVEGKVDNIAGTLSNAVAGEFQLASNLSGQTVGSMTLVNAQVVTNAGTITSLTGLGLALNSNTGTVGTYTGVAIAPANGTVTNNYAIFIGDLVASSLVIGLFSTISAGAGKYNIFANGTARNFLAGHTSFGADLGAITMYVASENGFAGKMAVTLPGAVSGYWQLVHDTADNHLRAIDGGGLTLDLGAFS